MQGAGRGADEIVLPPLPPQGGYEVWRFQVNAAILAASARPAMVLHWLSEIDAPAV